MNNWKTIGKKILGDGTKLRKQIHKITRAQRIQQCRVSPFWKTLNDEESHLELLAWDIPKRLAARHDDPMFVQEVPLSNTLSNRWFYVPLLNQKAFILRKLGYEVSEDGIRYNDGKAWRLVESFFKK